MVEFSNGPTFLTIFDMATNDLQISKFLSLILRHKPEAIGLKLDKHGWADVDELISRARKSGQSLTRELLKNVVVNNDKQRFSFSADGSRIRANQGHSINVDVDLTAHEPPAELFHGTVKKFLESILSVGLQKQNRLYVHLSGDIETASKVGSRRGQPIVLKIRAGKMSYDGFKFYFSANGVWLVDHVPPEYISTIEN